MALKLFRATPLQSPALDRLSSLLGKAASAEGSDTAARRRGNGEIPFLWSEHRPAKSRTSERLEKLHSATYVQATTGLPTSGQFGRYSDQKRSSHECTPHIEGDFRPSLVDKCLTAWEIPIAFRCDCYATARPLVCGGLVMSSSEVCHLTSASAKPNTSRG